MGFNLSFKGLNVNNHSNNKVFQDYIWSKYCIAPSDRTYCPVNDP